MQVRVWHSVSEPGHCEAWVHCTQLVPLHTVPLFWLHAVFGATAGKFGLPLVHVCEVHWLPSSAGRSVSKFTATIEPAPSQRFCLQSPAVCEATTVAFDA